MSLEAMKLALDALEKCAFHKLQPDSIQSIANYYSPLLRQAIETYNITNQCGETCERAKLCAVCARGLEQAEKQEHDLNDVRCECCGYMTYHREHMGCIKAAYQQAEKQEPVAWSVLNKRTGKHWYTHESRYTAQYYANEYSYRESDNTPSMVVTPLYTAPPKRKWIGLTDEEVDCLEFEIGHDNFLDFARAIEAKLKERNHGY
jgi:hypothetical protein